jgi:uncharacterized OsmC-like protein
MSIAVHAEFQPGERVVFTARDRGFVNVRRATEDGPIGFTSIELLMIALGNCTLGILMGQEAMKDAAIRSVTAELAGEMEADPPRLARVVTEVRIETTEPERLLDGLGELESAVCRCPVCNSLNADRQLRITIAEAASVGPEGRMWESAGISCALPSR